MYNSYAARRLCNRTIISEEVTFEDDVLIINIPEAAYNNAERYCIVIAQAIPDTTTVNATVAITIGDDDTQYPLLNMNGTNVLARDVNTRTRYSTTVRTNVASGAFVLNGRLPCSTCNEVAPSLPLPAAAAATSTTNSGN